MNKFSVRSLFFSLHLTWPNQSLQLNCVFLFLILYDRTTVSFLEWLSICLSIQAAYLLHMYKRHYSNENISHYTLLYYTVITSVSTHSTIMTFPLAIHQLAVGMKTHTQTHEEHPELCTGNYWRSNGGFSTRFAKKCVNWCLFFDIDFLPLLKIL